MKPGKKDFPEQIRIENTTRCNAACTICPREKLTRPQGTMPLGDFRRLIDQCDPALLKDLHLQGFGEPLLDPDFVEKIKYAREKLPRTRLFFVTNASLLKGDLARGIIGSGADKIKVSFYGVTAAKYESIHRPLKFDEVRKNILGFLKLRKELGARRPKLSVKFIGSLPEMFLFALRWMGRTKVEFSRVHNYGTGRNYNASGNGGKRVCPMVSRPIMQILWNGDVVPCCYDFNGEYVIGNALSDGLKEVWNSRRYELIRRLNDEFRLFTVPMCGQCDKLR